MSVGWDVKLRPSVKDNNPLGTQKTVSIDFEKEWAREGRQGIFKIP